MASTRPTRKSSRRSSPYGLGRHVKDSPTPSSEPPPKATEAKRTFMDEWVEPPLRAPAPSFEDYRGVERQGVLMQMAPLGQLPPNKAKGKGKGDGPKRLLTFKRAEAAAAREEATTPELPSGSTTSRRRSESRRIEEPRSKTPNTRATVSAQITTQHTPTPTPTQRPANPPSVPPSPVRPSSARSSSKTVPRFGTPTGQAKMRAVVEAAVKRSAQLNAHNLGNALRELYDDSFHDPKLAELLEAVLNQQATAQQGAEFQDYIKQARRKVKGEGSVSSAGGRQSSVAGRAPSVSTPNDSIASSSKSPSKNLHLSTTGAGSSRISKRSQAVGATAKVASRSSDLARKEKAGVGTKGATVTAHKSGDTPNTRKAMMTRRSARRSRSNSETSSLSSLDPSMALSELEDEWSGEADSPSASAHDETNGGNGGYDDDGHRINHHNHDRQQNHQSARHSTSTPAPHHAHAPINSVEASPTTIVGGPKLHIFPTTKTTTTTTTTTTNAATASTLPVAAANVNSITGSARDTSQNLSSSHPSSATPSASSTTIAGNTAAAVDTIATEHRSKKRTSSAAGLDVDDEDDERDRVLAAKRMRYRKDDFGGVAVKESHLRVSPTLGDDPEPRRRSFAAAKSALVPSPASRSASTRPSRLRNGTAKSQVSGYEVDDRDRDRDRRSPALSSTAADLPAPPAYATQDHFSRPGTPTHQGRVSKKTKKTARVKMSPIKTKSGVIAGIGRSGPRLDSPTGYGNVNDRAEDDNEDFCAACGGNGDLLCCDGCDRSFHFTCLDPPMDRNQLPETWFCFKCLARRDPIPKHPRGLFSSLLNELDKKNPVSFRLPVEIREYFEGVRTGEEGEYEEVERLKPKGRSGYEEATDFLKLKDSKGQVMLCYRCGKSALNRQEMIPCDFCSLHWHLDCVDPPMANPPPRGPNGRQIYTWMCPNHVQHELLAHDPALPFSTRNGTGGMVIRKVRRPKNAKIVDINLRRGFRNNGVIEIDNDSSDDEGFEDTQHFGTVYRLPEKGIKLDFISKVKQQRMRNKSRSESATVAAANEQQRLQAAARVKADFNRRSFLDRKLTLNLLEFAQAKDDPDLNADQIDNLLDTLIAEAPEEVTAILTPDRGAQSPADKTATRLATSASAIPPSPPSSDSRPDPPEPSLTVDNREKRMLLLLQELIQRKLESGGQ